MLVDQVETQKAKSLEDIERERAILEAKIFEAITEEGEDPRKTINRSMISRVLSYFPKYAEDFIENQLDIVSRQKKRQLYFFEGGTAVPNSAFHLDEAIFMITDYLKCFVRSETGGYRNGFDVWRMHLQSDLERSYLSNPREFSEKVAHIQKLLELYQLDGHLTDESAAYLLKIALKEVIEQITKKEQDVVIVERPSQILREIEELKEKMQRLETELKGLEIRQLELDKLKRVLGI